jgi:prenyltransferase beta subunit
LQGSEKEKMTKWLVAQTKHVLGGKREHKITEKPLLHVCCAEDQFADVNVDIRSEVNPDYVCDVTKELPFKDEMMNFQLPLVIFLGKKIGDLILQEQ